MTNKEIIDELISEKCFSGGLIIGSAAFYADAEYENDIDIVCYEKDINYPWIKKDDYSGYFIFKDRYRIEILLADKQESLHYLMIYKGYYEKSVRNNKLIINSLFDNFIIKAAHIHIGKNQRKWERQIFLFHRMYEKIIKEYYLSKEYIKNEVVNHPFYLLHKKVTNERVKQRNPKLLGVSKEDFFDDVVTKYIEHDYIHEQVAFYDKPLFTRLQKDNTVTCHEELWNNLDNLDKIKCVAEEACVITIERYILPTLKGKINKNNQLDFRKGLKWSLYRICTTLCSGWFREFAIWNYEEILNFLANEGYFQIFKTLPVILNKIEENEKM